MMIKVETREFHLDQVIEDLWLAKLSLDDYSRSLEQKDDERTRELCQKNELPETEIQERLMVEKDFQKANHELERLSKIDGLTLAANRRFFDEWLAKTWATHAAAIVPRPDVAPSQLVKAADAALYEAKARDRNRVVWKMVGNHGMICDR